MAKNVEKDRLELDMVDGNEYFNKFKNEGDEGGSAAIK